VRQVAEALQVSTSTVYQLCAQGRLPHFRVSNAIRIEPTVLERFCAKLPSVSEDAGPKERPGASEDPQETLR
jgi:excisionase family DNA binding protein